MPEASATPNPILFLLKRVHILQHSSMMSLAPPVGPVAKQRWMHVGLLGTGEGAFPFHQALKAS